ncbi:MAG: hypothetical protein ACJ786_25180 [Catenulispora sp.]
MSLIVLASDKGSPGVTTTAVALAGVWPRRAILAECDPSGGDLVYRIPAESGAPLNPNIGMLSLATTSRHGLSAHQLEQHLQRMHGGLELVTGLATGDQSAGLAGLWPALGRAFDSLPDADVIADCGRVDASSPVLDLMAGAALVILVARTSAEQIAHVRDRALSLLQRVGGGTATAGGGLGVPIGVILIVDPKQRARVPAQVDELLRSSGLPVKVIGTIADDPDGADLINGRGRGRLDRTLLIRSAREVAQDLSGMYSAAGAAAAPQQPQPQAAPNPLPGPGYGPPPPTAPRQPAHRTPERPTMWPAEQPNSGFPQPAPQRGPFPPASQQPPAPSTGNSPDRRQQPPQPPSAHSGFTSVTLGGGPDPRHTATPPGLAPVPPQNGAPIRSSGPMPIQPHSGTPIPPPGQSPIQPQNSAPLPPPGPLPVPPQNGAPIPQDPRDQRPPRGEIAPGTGGHRAGPPQGDRR